MSGILEWRNDDHCFPGRWVARRNLHVGINEVQVKHKTSLGAIVYIYVYEGYNKEVEVRLSVAGVAVFTLEEMSGMCEAAKEASTVIKGSNDE